MGRRSKQGRYEVTGPGVGERIFYEDDGPALSRTITLASKWHGEGTWYVRDIDDSIIGHTDRDRDGLITTRRKA